MRYIILVLLNLPIILLALINIVTQYKLKKITAVRFRHQIILWIILLIVLVGSFPIYNYVNDRPPLDSSELSLFDVAQTTAIVVLIYAANTQRRRSEQNEKAFRDLHQELSISLSKDHGKN